MSRNLTPAFGIWESTAFIPPSTQALLPASRTLDAHPALCSTSFKVMHTSIANANLFPVLHGAMPIPSMRISGPNLRAGNLA
jgi:hypothetical protein